MVPRVGSTGIPIHPTPAQKKLLEEQKLKKVATELEGVFLSLVIKQMQATVPRDGLFNNDTSRMFTEMLDDEFGKLMARGQGIGLARQIIRAVQRQQ